MKKWYIIIWQVLNTTPLNCLLWIHTTNDVCYFKSKLSVDVFSKLFCIFFLTSCIYFKMIVIHYNSEHSWQFWVYPGSLCLHQNYRWMCCQSCFVFYGCFWLPIYFKTIASYECTLVLFQACKTFAENVIIKIRSCSKGAEI